jgi:dTDP-glucose 4,6-dehydratase
MMGDDCTSGECAQLSWEQGLDRTINWYRDNPAWVDHVRSGDYREYYQRMYGSALA